MTIKEPGIYADISSDDYFSDPCPTPSLTQSIAKVLIEKSPLHAMYEHPRLCPVDVDDDAEKYDSAKAIGNAAHAILIGRGKDVAIGEFDAWTTKDARAFKDAALEAGKVAILAKHYSRAEAMVKSARTQIAAHEASDAFTAGRGEVMLAWQEGCLWFRSLVDWLHDDLRTVDDFKTGAVSAAPHALPPRMVDAGWDIQAAMYERGLDVLDPAGRGRRKFRFIVQENRPPFALSVAELPESVLTIGRKKLDFAVAAWRACMKSGAWPGYPLEVVRPLYPEFKERQWLDREIEHDERQSRARTAIPDDILMAG